jgi:hypothetical protein
MQGACTVRWSGGLFEEGETVARPQPLESTGTFESVGGALHKRSDQPKCSAGDAIGQANRASIFGQDFRRYLRSLWPSAMHSRNGNEDSDVVGLNGVNLIEKIVTVTARLIVVGYLGVALVTAVLASRVNWTGCEASTPIPGENVVIGAAWPWTLPHVVYKLRHADT